MTGVLSVSSQQGIHIPMPDWILTVVLFGVIAVVLIITLVLLTA